MNEKTMGAIPVSALERLEQSAVKLSLITFCLRHEELKAAPDAAEIHSIKSDLSRALREVITNAAACALTGGATEKASPPAGAEPKRIQRKEVPKRHGLRCPAPALPEMRGCVWPVPAGTQRQRDLPLRRRGSAGQPDTV